MPRLGGVAGLSCPAPSYSIPVNVTMVPAEDRFSGGDCCRGLICSCYDDDLVAGGVCTQDGFRTRLLGQLHWLLASF